MPDLSPYLGRWVALVRGAVVATGQTRAQAEHMAKDSRPKDEVALLHVTPQVQIARAVRNYPLIATVFALAREWDTPVYLVGGTVRDLLIGADTHDLDFAVDGDGLSIARRVADHTRGAYVALDRDRGMGRVVISGSLQGARSLYLDFASLRGPDLEADLRERDFTVNAMAAGLLPGGAVALIDPLSGLQDLVDRTLRATHPGSLISDPIRTLRAIRLQAQLACTLDPQTRRWVREAGSRINQTSPERIRDEWFKVLALPAATQALREMHGLGLLGQVAPPVAGLEGISQSPPHRFDVLTHAMETVHAVERLWETMSGGVRMVALVDSDSFRAVLPQILERYRAPICDERSHLAALKCAALLHDVGKQETASVEGTSKVRFIGHEHVGARIAAHLARTWRCSRVEVDLIHTAVQAHMRPTWLAAQQAPPTRRAIYRYFRDTGQYGVDAAFIALADYLATWGPDLPEEGWQRQVETVMALWHAAFALRESVVDPPPLLSGHDLIQIGLIPGPQIGELLDRLREEQAAGEIATPEQALARVRTWIEDRGDKHAQL
jgi:putative nucleotidyltransferase with HDIG domain